MKCNSEDFCNVTKDFKLKYSFFIYLYSSKYPESLMLFSKILSSTTVFNIETNKKCIEMYNHYIRMISE